MKDYMTIPEYVIAPQYGITVEVAEKIRKYHIFPMNSLRNRLDFPIIVSKKSGFRHEEHEKAMGRALTSTHLFKEIPERQDPGWGAGDYTVASAHYYKFVTGLLQDKIYNRLIFYPQQGFIHGDYRFINVERFYYVMQNGILNQVTELKLLDAVWNRYVKLPTNINTD